MARVKVQLRNHELSRSETGILFEVRDPKGVDKLGDLLVSKGGLRWFPKGTVNARKLTWRQAARLFEGNGTIEKKRP